MDLKSDLLGLKSKLESIEKDFSEKLCDVSEKEELQKRLDEKVTDIVNAKKAPLVNLNIGGKIYPTKISTLMSCKDTVFYNIVKKHEEEGTKLPEELFFDRSYMHFDLIMNYLRSKTINTKKMNKYDREDIFDELQFYGLSNEIQISKKEEYEIEWDQGLSKQGACTVGEDKKVVKVHSTTCYTHFVTNKAFSNEDFQVELEVAVTQSDNYLYVGIYNSGYSLTGNCGCCNPANAFYIQCDGSVHINATRTDNTSVAWQSQKIIIGMKVYLSESQKKMYFYFPEKNDLELGPYNLTGNSFRVYAGHCNSGNGEIKILDCFAIRE